MKEKIVYSNSLVPPGYTGFTMYPYICIRKDLEGFAPLLEHERVHWRKQQEVGLFKFIKKYYTQTDFRRDVEVEAYKVSVKNGVPIERAAKSLSTKYRLGITYEEAVKLLEA